MTTTDRPARLLPGAAAPAPLVADSGGRFPLSEVWRDGPALITFLRHLG